MTEIKEYNIDISEISEYYQSESAYRDDIDILNEEVFHMLIEKINNQKNK